MGKPKLLKLGTERKSLSINKFSWHEISKSRSLNLPKENDGLSRVRGKALIN